MNVWLDHPDFGELEMGCDPYVVVSITVGAPVVRSVIKRRALASGVRNLTRYTGERVISVLVRGKTSIGCSAERNIQDLVDRLSPYMSADLRPTLRWVLPRSNPVAQLRWATVQPEGLPYSIDQPKHPFLPLQFVCEGEIFGPGPGGVLGEVCETITPSLEREAGRIYDLIHDRIYPASAPAGDRRIDNVGTARTHWHLTISGPVEDPEFWINGVRVKWTGVDLLVGQTLEVSTRDRTMYLGGLPSASAYVDSNFTEWSWDDLMLRPRENVVKFTGADVGAQASARLCYLPTFVA